MRCRTISCRRYGLLSAVLLPGFLAVKLTDARASGGGKRRFAYEAKNSAGFRQMPTISHGRDEHDQRGPRQLRGRRPCRGQIVRSGEDSVLGQPIGNARRNAPGLTIASGVENKHAPISASQRRVDAGNLGENDPSANPTVGGITSCTVDRVIDLARATIRRSNRQLQSERAFFPLTAQWLSDRSRSLQLPAGRSDPSRMT